jgi:Flp pilus assembly protein TadD
MSLLLEALKKAEKAKEDAQRRAQGGELRLADEAPAAAPVDAPAKPVLTRPELPDITAPLEILTEDLAARPAAGDLATEAPPSPPRRTVADAQAADRAAARKVFEVKVREPNPRLPFFIAVGALGAFAVGTVIYFWIQLRGPALLVNTNPPPVAENPVTAAPVARAAPAGSTMAPVQPAIPGLPPSLGATLPLAAAKPPAPAAPARPATPAIPRDAPVPRMARIARPAALAERAPEAGALATNRPAPQVNPHVASAYAAYQAGNLDSARSDYRQALRDEPGNRDALLGLAAVETRAQRYEFAVDIYERLLHADPRDPYAQAALLALRGQSGDPVAVESRLKTLLSADPGSGVLHFALGNHYVQQRRWADAQQSYFRAVASDPDNPDYAYNLAVSLDQLHQPGAALDYYRRALALAQKRIASFAPAAAQERVQQLAR